MGLFRRRTRDLPASAEPDESAPATPGDEALASVVRVFGKYAVAVEGDAEGDLEARCEAWARHLLLSTRAPIGELDEAPEETGDSSPSKRAYADLTRFVGERRVEERDFVDGALGELKKVLLAVVVSLVQAVDEDSSDDAAVEDELSALTSAAQSNDLGALKAQVAKTVLAIQEQVLERKARRASHLAEMQDQMKRMNTDLFAAKNAARRDPLTQLENRGALDEALDRFVTLARVTGQPLTAVMVDLDHFKKLNDTYGHPAGDAVLKATADGLVRCFLRKVDLVARYGGEEFCVLLPHTGELDAIRLVNRFLDALRERPLEHGEHAIEVTASAGVAELKPGALGHDLLRRADEALYAAKHRGRDRAERSSKLLAEPPEAPRRAPRRSAATPR